VLSKCLPKEAYLDGWNVRYEKVSHSSEENEDLLDVAINVLYLLADDVEADGLRKRAALSDGHDITSFDAEGR